jgi:LytS/YehU family sensor histidine kinase
MGTYFFRADNSPRIENMPPREAAFNSPHPIHPPPPGRRDIIKPPAHPRPEPIPPFVSLIILSILIVGFDTGLKVSMKWAQSEREKINLEKENVENQLAFLRNQVSPHFFMNTLNNIHALIDYDAKEAKESVIKLSKLMRHLLYESDGELTSIKKEVDFIKSYIELMKLRFSEKVRINLHLPTELPDKSVPPLLFTSFLENAFKHGISYNEKSFIDISLQLTDENLIFEIRNSNPQKQSENLDSGIGIENTRKRLDLIYKDNYTLKIKDKEELFIVNLTVPI